MEINLKGWLFHLKSFQNGHLIVLGLYIILISPLKHSYSFTSNIGCMSKLKANTGDLQSSYQNLSSYIYKALFVNECFSTGCPFLKGGFAISFQLTLRTHLSLG